MGSLSKLLGYKEYEIGDNGWTYGFGHWISYDDSTARQEFREKYYKENYVSLKDCEKVLRADISVSEKKINEFVKNPPNKGKNPHIKLTQDEFDALVVERHLSGSLNVKIRNLLIEKNRNRKKWSKALMYNKTNPKFIEGWKNRRDDIMELFFDGDGKRTH